MQLLLRKFSSQAIKHIHPCTQTLGSQGDWSLKPICNASRAHPEQFGRTRGHKWCRVEPKRLLLCGCGGNPTVTLGLVSSQSGGGGQDT